MERFDAKLAEVSKLKEELTPEETHTRILNGTCDQALGTVELAMRRPAPSFGQACENREGKLQKSSEKELWRPTTLKSKEFQAEMPPIPWLTSPKQSAQALKPQIRAIPQHPTVRTNFWPRSKTESPRLGTWRWKPGEVWAWAGSSIGGVAVSLDIGQMNDDQKAEHSLNWQVSDCQN